MKKLFLLLSFLLVFCVGVKAEEKKIGTVNIQVPNLEFTGFLDFSGDKIVDRKVGATSKILSISDFDVRVGYIEGGIYVASFGFDLTKLEKLGLNIQYAWKDNLDLSVGGWAGFNFTDEKFSYGVLGVFLKVYLK